MKLDRIAILQSEEVLLVVLVPFSTLPSPSLPFPKSKSHRYLCAIFIYWKLCRVPFNLLHWSARPLLDGSNKYVSTLSSQTTLTINIIIIYHCSSALFSFSEIPFHTTSNSATITNSSDLLKLYLVMKNMPSPFRLMWVRQGQK